jgi:hypothetical protein
MWVSIFLRDVVVEFLNLFLNVAQERVTGPATNHHNEKIWAAGVVHA